MDIKRLASILEAVLFLAGAPVPIGELCTKLNVTKKELEEAEAMLKEVYTEERGINIIRFNGKLQLGTNSDYAEEVSSVLNTIKERELSRTCLETVAIIAYKQPVTKLEVENIRGVNSDYAIQNLLKHNLILPVGRKDVIGKPILYGTGDEFLKRFGLHTLDELPDYDALMERINVLKMPASDSLYNFNDFELPVQEETPDFLEGEEIQRVE